MLPELIDIRLIRTATVNGTLSDMEKIADAAKLIFMEQKFKAWACVLRRHDSLESEAGNATRIVSGRIECSVAHAP